MDEQLKKISLNIPEKAYTRLKQEAAEQKVPLSLIMQLLIQEHAYVLSNGKKFYYLKDELRPRPRNLEQESMLMSLAKELGVEVKPLPVPVQELIDIEDDAVKELEELIRYD